jgi:hypothetical protein
MWHCVINLSAPHIQPYRHGRRRPHHVGRHLPSQTRVTIFSKKESGFSVVSSYTSWCNESVRPFMTVRWLGEAIVFVDRSNCTVSTMLIRITCFKSQNWFSFLKISIDWSDGSNLSIHHRITVSEGDVDALSLAFGNELTARLNHHALCARFHNPNPLAANSCDDN